MNVYPGFSRLRWGPDWQNGTSRRASWTSFLGGIAEWSEEVNSNLGNQFFVRLHCFILLIFQLHFSQLVSEWPCYTREYRIAYST